MGRSVRTTTCSRGRPARARGTAAARRGSPPRRARRAPGRPAPHPRRWRRTDRRPRAPSVGRARTVPSVRIPGTAWPTRPRPSSPPSSASCTRRPTGWPCACWATGPPPRTPPPRPSPAPSPTGSASGELPYRAAWIMKVTGNVALNVLARKPPVLAPPRTVEEEDATATRMALHTALGLPAAAPAGGDRPAPPRRPPRGGGRGGARRRAEHREDTPEARAALPQGELGLGRAGGPACGLSSTTPLPATPTQSSRRCCGAAASCDACGANGARPPSSGAPPRPSSSWASSPPPSVTRRDPDRRTDIAAPTTTTEDTEPGTSTSAGLPPFSVGTGARGSTRRARARARPSAPPRAATRRSWCSRCAAADGRYHTAVPRARLARAVRGHRGDGRASVAGDLARRAHDRLPASADAPAHRPAAVGGLPRRPRRHRPAPGHRRAPRRRRAGRPRSAARARVALAVVVARRQPARRSPAPVPPGSRRSASPAPTAAGAIRSPSKARGSTSRPGRPTAARSRRSASSRPGLVDLWLLDPDRAVACPIALPAPALDARGVTLTLAGRRHPRVHPDGRANEALRALDIATGVGALAARSRVRSASRSPAGTTRSSTCRAPAHPTSPSCAPGRSC